MILSMNYYADKYLNLKRRLKEYRHAESLAELIRDVGFYQSMIVRDKIDGTITEETFDRIYNKYQKIMNEAVHKIMTQIYDI